MIKPILFFRKAAALLQMPVLLAGALCVSCSAGSAEVEPVPFWKPISWGGKLIVSPEAALFQTVSIENLQQLEATTRLSLVLPDKTSITIYKVREERPNKRAFVWYGKVDGDAESMVIFAVVNDTLAGDIMPSRGKMYRVKVVERPVYLVEEIDPARFPIGGQALPPPEAVADEVKSYRSSSCAPDPPDKIDVMVVYTDLALTAAGGVDGMLAAVQLAFAETNTSYSNSSLDGLVGISPAPVYVGPATTASGSVYAESRSLQTDLYTLQGTLQRSLLKPVRDLRDQHAADIVVLITEQTNQRASACGLAFEMHLNIHAYEKFAFAAIPYDCMNGPSALYFGHELGHIMGADHDAVSGTSPPHLTPSNYGHVCLTSASPWRTMMAENVACPSDCPRIPYWSTPNLSYGGQPLGAPDGSEDNAQVLITAAPTVANYRNSQHCP